MNSKKTHEIFLNLYHKWAYLDEISQALHQNIDKLSEDLTLSVDVIKIIRILNFLDGISYSIFNSFCHPNHPEQVDIHKKIDWIRSLKEILQQWHHIFHVFLQDRIKELNSDGLVGKIACYPIKNKKTLKLCEDFNTPSLADEKNELKKMHLYWSKKHAAIFFPKKNALKNWQMLQHIIVDPLFILTVTEDQNLDSVKQKYAHIEPFFRGIHQMLEVAMSIIVDDSEKLQQDIKKLTASQDGTQLDPTQSHQVVVLREKMNRIQQWWEIAAANIMLLSKMDTGSYAEYRQALLGTSGGDSKQLRQLKNITTQLHFALPLGLRDHTVLANVLDRNSSDPLLNQLVSSIRELQAVASDFWLRHFTLTVNTIGMIRGSQGLPVEKLLSFAVGSLMRKDSLLQVVGNVGQSYAQHPEALIVKVDHNREKIIGSTIFSHVKNQFQVVSQYTLSVSVQEPILDALELRPLEPNDTGISPYASWFNPDAHTHGLRFGSHSMGMPIVLFNDIVTRTANRLIELQDDYWQTFFNVRIAQFQKTLFKTLDISDNNFFAVSVDANVTALLERLISALPKNHKSVVLTTNQEFIAVNRVLASSVADNQFKIHTVTIDSEATNLALSFCDAIQEIGEKLKLVIFSQVMSNSQISLTPQELTDILNAVPNNVPIIIDATQGMFNVPMPWGEILGNKKNVYLLGSTIKHGRSTSGLGFLIYSRDESLLNHPKKSGWCAYLSGLTAGRTTNDDGSLLYDEALQWFGGTPSNVFVIDIFINTWDAILRAGENLQSMHQYVQSLHAYFFQLLAKHNIRVIDGKRREIYPEYSSNVVVLGLPAKQAQQLVHCAAEQNIYFDYREKYGVRIGFGIQHSRKDVEKLVDVIISPGSFSQ
jgi:selenocysteine lyase/cysteine desulfurase